MIGPRIGVVFSGDPSDPRVRSGTPFGVYSALGALGYDVVACDVEPHGAVRAAVGVVGGLKGSRPAHLLHNVTKPRAIFSVGMLSHPVARTRSAVGRRRLVHLGLDGAVCCGTHFDIGDSAPFVTYEDMTVRQALRGPYPAWRAMRAAEARRRITMQSEVYRRAAGVCMATAWAARSAKDEYGVPGTKVHVVGAGAHEVPREVSRDLGRPRLLFIGLDWERKNGPRVLKAFERLRSTHPGAHLDVVGGHPPLTEPGVMGHGRLRRDVPAERELLSRLFDEATLLVMPSLYEPGGVVFLEAAASGLPVIGGNVGGSADFIGEAGVTVDPADDDGLFYQMVRLTDPVVAQAYSAEARRRAELFTWRSVAQRIVRSLDPRLVVGEPARDLS